MTIIRSAGGLHQSCVSCIDP